MDPEQPKSHVCILQNESEMARSHVRIARSETSQGSVGLGCLTISYEDAMRREEEFWRRLKLTNPHLRIFSNTVQFPSSHQFQGPSQGARSVEANKSTAACDGQPSKSLEWGSNRHRPNLPAPLKKIRAQPSTMQLLRSLNPCSSISFYCKICGVDCQCERNFKAHIGGKKHQARKLEILGPGGAANYRKMQWNRVITSTATIPDRNEYCSVPLPNHQSCGNIGASSSGTDVN